MDNIGLVCGSFHKDEVEQMIHHAQDEAKKQNLNIIEIVWVPGSMEAPLATARLLEEENIEGVACLGIIEKGETGHGAAMGQAVIKSLIDLQLGYPIGLADDSGPCTLWILDGVLRLSGPSPCHPSKSLTYGLIQGPSLIRPETVPDHSLYRFSVSSPGLAYTFSADLFEHMRRELPELASWCESTIDLPQLGPVLPHLVPHLIPDSPKPFRQLLARFQSAAVVHSCQARELSTLDQRDVQWFLLEAFPGPDCTVAPSAGLPLRQLQDLVRSEPGLMLKLLQLPNALLGAPHPEAPLVSSSTPVAIEPPDPWAPSASTPLPQPSSNKDVVESTGAESEPRLDPTAAPTTESFPIIRAEGQIPEAVACFRMLAKVLGFPVKSDVLARLLEEQIQRSGGLSLQLCAALAEYFEPF